VAEYGIWLSFNNQEEGFQIPVTPASIEISEGGNSKTYDVAALGEINVIKSPKLSEINFESEFPGTDYPYCVTTPKDPFYYVELINKWRATKRPIRFVFTGTAFDINMAASIESFDWKEVAGEQGDIQYSMKLKKYVFYAAKRVVVTQASGSAPAVVQQGQPARPTDKQPPKTYKLAPGDNLWTVSKKAFGTDAYVNEIQKLNGITDAQLKKLPIGLELQLPKVGNYA
jgi:hypothetical protein